jgi:4-alpha-glucanotransferase
MTPVVVAGVPPDEFSADGQLWGNPIYDWDYQKRTNYAWWRKRLEFSGKLYDIMRIDHFRAFADYYTIPYGSKTAKNGKWEKGVGLYFWDCVRPSIGNASIIAEDLGGETEEVRQLISETGFPDMKVLQFAFDSDTKDPFLPKNFNRICVCYTGTHDNDTTLGWYNKATEKELLIFSKLVPKIKNYSPVFNLISFGMKSKAKLVIIPLQDYLELDSDCRTNTPGISNGNWEWRFEKNDINDSLKDTILHLTKKRN